MLKLTTAYPPRVDMWESYIDNDIDLFIDDDILSIYIHIPFCINRCSFCPYTTIKTPGVEEQLNYIDYLFHKVKDFIDQNEGKILKGLDIGGGTPLSLSERALRKLMSLVKLIENSFVLDDKYNKSIESTLEEITLEKLSIVSTFDRISFGYQSSNKLKGRVNSTSIIDIKMRYLDNFIVNIDLMYGLKEQTVESFINDVMFIISKNPEHITLYETYYTTEIYSEEILWDYYIQAYNLLKVNGYKARLGSNTFTKLDDYGLSNYLESRVFDLVPYKGFGYGAQSMSNKGVSYEEGQNLTDLDLLKHKVSYKLPDNEIYMKQLCVGFYNNHFIIKDLLGTDFLNSLEIEELIVIYDDFFIFTSKGLIKYKELLGKIYLHLLCI